MKRFLYGLVVGVLGAALVGAGARAALAASRTEHAPTAPEAKAPAPERAEEPAVRVTPAMVRYSHTGYALYFAGVFVHALVLVGFLRFRISERLRRFADERTSNRFLQACIYFPLLTIATTVVLLPLALYGSFLVPHQYGLSTQKLSGWLADDAKETALYCVLASPLVALVYWTLRRNPRRWWFWFWLATIPLALFSAYAEPLVIAPLFNRYQPLRNVRLRDRLLALAASVGIERGHVFEVDASRRTRTLNGYVTGIGGSARIVLWDTLLQRMDEDEITVVMAHEMGHYVERHVPIGLALAICGSLPVLWLVDWSARRVLRVNGPAWGVRGLDDLASVPLLLLILLLINFFGSPVQCAVSRVMEERADTFALRHTHDPQAAARAFVKLSEQNLSLPNPPPFVHFWIGTHPTLAERIRKAVAYERMSE